ncbi:hypothetical protein [Kitasatospora griseola]|uniref:hypothetical protein n=1 Tax=Kitasatospora griseola TaxID=2064 RepID=UPI00167169E9|nr:hypothetical protein [Kitasatospora griseola]GGQ84432.1 hypothetical protein GCM10010195_45150 [Kitasatospora griseola]
MTATDRAGQRSWHWYGVAGLASVVVPAVFLQALRLAEWQVSHPVIVPDDGSPGGGNMGSVVAVPTLGLALLAGLVIPVLWGAAAVRARTGRTVGTLPTITMVLQGVGLLFAFAAARALPHGLPWGAALVASGLLAVAAVRVPRRPGRTAAVQ